MASPKQPQKRDQLAVILEEMWSELKRVSEGHTQLDQKLDRLIQELREEMRQEFAVVRDVLKAHSQDLKAHSQDLKAHSQEIKQLQAAVEGTHQAAQRIENWTSAHDRIHSG